MGLLRESPLPWFLAALAAAFLVQRLLRRMPEARQSFWLQAIAMATGILMLLVFLWLDIVSLHSFMLDSDEANILSIAAASLHGQPIFHATNDPGLSYALPYGPNSFLIYRWLLSLVQQSFYGLRVVLVLGNIAFCAVLYGIFRKFTSRATSMALMAFPLAPLMHWVKCCYGVRADLWILLSLSLAARCAMLEAELPAAILVGIFTGIAIGFKATTAPAFLLLLLALWRSKGPRAAIIAAVVGTGTAFAPFLLPGMELRNYFAWLSATRTEGISHTFLIFEVAYVVCLLAPFFFLRVFGIRLPGGKSSQDSPAGRSPSVFDFAVVALCVTASVLVAAKPGAGPWHLWQLLPVLAGYLALSLGRAQNSLPRARVICLIAVTSAAYGLSFTSRDLRLLRPPDAATQHALMEGRTEINKYLARYSGTVVEMGYGQNPNEPVELLRYLLPLGGQPYTLDGSGRLESTIYPFPRDVVAHMEQCAGRTWLIPHGDRPFDSTFFPALVRKTFLEHFVIGQQGEVYDAWVCAAPAS